MAKLSSINKNERRKNLVKQYAAKYEKLKAVADATFVKAIPYFEQAHELKPDDKPTIQQLKTLYAKTQNKVKFEEMKKLLGE